MTSLADLSHSQGPINTVNNQYNPGITGNAELEDTGVNRCTHNVSTVIKIDPDELALHNISMNNTTVHSEHQDLVSVCM